MWKFRFEEIKLNPGIARFGDRCPQIEDTLEMSHR